MITNSSALSLSSKTEDLDMAWQLFSKEFVTISDTCAPFKCVRVKQRHNPWITADLIKKMNVRDNLHKLASRKVDVNATSKYKKLRNEITREIKKSKKNFYDKLTEEHKSKPKSFWKELSKIMPSKVNMCSVPKDITPEKFNIYFSTIGQKTVNSLDNHDNNTSNTTQDKHLYWRGNTSIYTLEWKQVVVDDVYKNLKKLSLNSSTDVLGFDSKLLRLAADLIAPQLTYMFNLSIRYGYVPPDWKLARVTPIYKGKGDQNDPSNFRPISVIGHIPKLIEKEIHVQFLKYLMDHSFITPDQPAYLKNHSTQTSLHKVVDDWLDNMNNGLITAACFLDIQKCFDTIDHDLLIAKLKCYGIRGNEIEWFLSYLSGRKQKVKVNNNISEALPVDIGVPQGSVLGPFLFLLFANDLSNFVMDGCVNCFADDTVIYVTGRTISEVTTKLQGIINDVRQWYLGNRLKVNPTKSEVMYIGTPQRLKHLNSNSVLKYGNDVLSVTNNIRYLGLILDSNLTWCQHISSIIRSVAPKIALMRRLSSVVPQSLSSKIFTTYLRPCLEYGITVWGGCSEEGMNKVQKFQNLAARIVKKNYDYINHRGLDIVESLGWHTIRQRRDYHLSFLMYKCVHGQAPDYLRDNVLLLSEMNDIPTRNTHSLKVYVPKPNIEKYKESFHYMGSKIWNSLSINIQEAPSKAVFKKRYRENVV
jgi:hypothetical protein